MGKTFRGQSIDTVFVLVIFCVFAASVLTVLMLGGSIYKNMADISRQGYDERTCLSYVWTKAKNMDEAGKISVGDFGGQTALLLKDEYGGVSYHTIIYYYDGWVYELFCEEGLQMSPEDGTRVIKTSSLAFNQMENGLIKAQAGSGSLLISPRSTATTAAQDNAAADDADADIYSDDMYADIVENTDTGGEIIIDEGGVLF